MPPKKIALPAGVNNAAAAAAGGNTANGGTLISSLTSAKAFASAPIKNDYGFVVNGTTPLTITGAQLVSALSDPANNALAIQRMTLDVAKVPGSMPGLTSISTNGNLTPAEATYLSNFAKQTVDSTPKGQAASVATKVTSSIPPQDITPWAINTTINNKDISQPNIQASTNLINTMFNDLLGRNATNDEISRYTDAYTKYAAANPVSTTTGGSTYALIQVPTASGSGTGVTNRLLKSSQNETTTSTGLSEPDYIQNQIRQSGEYGAAQGAGKAFDNLMQLARETTGAA
jgi:hypothetical protein